MTNLQTTPLHFIALTPEETRHHYPQYFREDITCFLIVKGKPRGFQSVQNSSSHFQESQKTETIPVGLYGLIDRGVDSRTGESLGEGFLTIFPAFRYRVLSKCFFAALFDHALSCGFAKVYTWTRLKSWQKLFQRFESLGIQCLDMPPPWNRDGSKLWFVKQHRKDG